jgi:putative transposase
MADRVHLFVKHEPKASASYVANQLKGYASRVLREEFPHLRSRMPTLWSSSFFVASVGAVSADTVQRYIDTQWERPWAKKEKGGAGLRRSGRSTRNAEAAGRSAASWPRCGASTRRSPRSSGGSRAGETPGYPRFRGVNWFDTA